MTVLEVRPASTTRSNRAPYLVAGAVALTTVGLRLHDPHATGSWGLCPLRTVTGLDCPFCGGLRAVNDLTHGHVAAAAASNLFFVSSIPLLLVLWLWWVRGATTTARVRAVFVVWAVAGAVFTVFRNTPWGRGLWA